MIHKIKKSCIQKGLILHGLLLFTSAHFAFLNAATINGRIYDALNNIYLQGIEITINETGQSTYTTSGGNFRFTNLESGSYTLVTSSSGYESVSQSVQVNVGESVSTTIFINTERDDVVELDAFVVSGTTSATVKALNLERSAADLRDVISSDAFGQFVDRNPAEALQRVAGVTVEDDQGEGTFVIIRGASPELSNIQLDGVELATPQPDGRRVNLNIITVDQLERIEVSKTWLPSQKGNTIGGTVNLVTRSALDRGERYLSLEGAYTQYDISDDASYRSNVTFGDTFDSEDWEGFGDLAIGFQVSVNYSEDNRGAETLGFNWNTDAAYPFGGDPLFGYTLVQNQWRDFSITREREGVSSKLEFGFNENHMVSFSVSYNKFNDDEVNRFFSRSANVGNDFNWDGDEFLTTANATELGYSLSDPEIIARLAAPPTSTTRRLTFDESINLGQLSYDPETNQFTFGSWTSDFDRNFRSEITEDELLTYQASGEHVFFETWEVEWNAYSTTAERNSEALFFSFDGQGGIINSVTGDGLPRIDPTEFTEVSLNPELYVISEPSGSGRVELFDETFTFSEDERTGFKLDIKKEFEWLDAFWTTQFGGTIDTREKVNSARDQSTQVAANAFDDNLYRDNRIRLSDETFFGGNSDSFVDNFGDFFNFGPTLSIDGLRSFAANPGNFGVTVSPDVNANTASSQFFDSIVDSYSLTEDITAFYFQQTLEIGKWSFIFGARWEETDLSFTSRNILTRDPAGKFRFVRPSFWRFLELDEFSVETTNERKYDHFLPAFHLRRDIGTNTVLRASATKTIARPQFTQLNGAEVPTLIGSSGYGTSARLPNFDTIDPMESINYDISIEHYFEPVGVVSFALFHKDLTGPIYLESRRNVGPDDETRAFAFRYDSRNANREGVDDPTLLNSSPWNFSQWTNAGDAELQGFEIAFSRRLDDLLPDVLTGFSIDANYAVFDSEVELLAQERTNPTFGDEELEPDAIVPLFRQPDRTANFSLIWEGWDIFARISYNLRGEYLNAVSTDDDIIDIIRFGGALSDDDVYLADQERWDFTLRYNPWENVQLFLEIINFTNEPQEVFLGDEDRLSSIRYTNPVYTFGVKANF